MGGEGPQSSRGLQVLWPPWWRHRLARGGEAAGRLWPLRSVWEGRVRGAARRQLDVQVGPGHTGAPDDGPSRRGLCCLQASQ